MKAQTGTPHRGRKSPSKSAISLSGTPGSVLTQPTSTPAQSRPPPSAALAFGKALGRTPARSASRSHSCCNSANEAPTAARRAIATTQPPGTHCGRESRINSLNRRRTRFRSTAQPTRLEVISPTLVEAHPRTTPTVMKRPLWARPSVFTRRNSELCVNRMDFGKVSGTKERPLNQSAERSMNALRVLKLSLGMAREVNLHALWQQTLATALTAAGKNGAAILGLHAFTEPELLLAGALGRLVGTFHKASKIRLEKERKLYRLPRRCQQLRGPNLRPRQIGGI